KAGDFFNEYFINVKMDMENGEGHALANRYGVRAYPSLFFIDYKEKVKKYAVGYHNRRQLLKLGETALED
ncbi:MAG: thioredoxin, partial [Cyclobacteriaceae bacterium]|nr:thioredoxin [Cyclobacteriaceae bacterium]